MNGYESNERFGTLDDYIKEKYELDSFAINGNHELMACLSDAGVGELRERKLKVLDIGPAIGALTTCMFLKKYPDLECEITLMDASMEVLEKTKNRKFEFSEHLVQDLQLQDSDISRIEHHLDQCEIVQHDIANPVSEELFGQFDVVLCGFVHHHLNLEGKDVACRNMASLAKDGGVVGIADECFSYRDFLAFQLNHLNATVKTATECFLADVSEHTDLFQGTSVSIEDSHIREGNRYYAFAGKKLSQVFICYASEDNELAEAFESAFNRRSHPIPAWRDKSKLESGDLHKQRIRSAIENSSMAVVFMSTSWLLKDYTKSFEWPLIYKQFGGNTRKIIIVPVDGVSQEQVNSAEFANAQKVNAVIWSNHGLSKDARPSERRSKMSELIEEVEEKLRVDK